MKKTHCERCGAPATSRTTSFFNEDWICGGCRLIESRHPQYEEAKRREFEELKKGNFKFPGIGLPDDLNPKKVKHG